MNAQLAIASALPSAMLFLLCSSFLSAELTLFGFAFVPLAVFIRARKLDSKTKSSVLIELWWLSGLSFLSLAVMKWWPVPGSLSPLIWNRIGPAFKLDGELAIDAAEVEAYLSLLIGFIGVRLVYRLFVRSRFSRSK